MQPSVWSLSDLLSDPHTPVFGQRMTLSLSQCGVFHPTLAYLEMLPGLGFCPPLPPLQVSLRCVGNRDCVFGCQCWFTAAGWTGMSCCGHFCPNNRIFVFRSDVSFTWNFTELYYTSWVQWFFWVFGKFDMLPCPFFFFFSLLGSSLKERVEIETLQLVITWKKKRLISVFLKWILKMMCWALFTVCEDF